MNEGMNTLIEAAVINNKGLVRTNNEDSFYLNGTFMPRNRMDEGAFFTGSSSSFNQLYAVCDGMGGADNGEDASFSAVHMLESLKPNLQALLDENVLTDTLRQMSDTISDSAAEKGLKSGTTLAMVLVDGDTAQVSNVGDSRVYRFHQGQLEQISRDHSKVQRMIDMGLITPEQARTDPERHKISQYLGMPKEIRCSPYIVSNIPLEVDDVYLICSDGLCDMVEDREIEYILRQSADPAIATRDLYDAAIRHGGRDNVTIIVLKVRSKLPQSEEIPPMGEAQEPTVRTEKVRKNPLMAVMTAAQIISAGAAFVTVMDLMYYLMRK